MALLSDKDRRAIRDRLKAMEQPVKLINFTQELECLTCRETGRLLRELAELSEKLSLKVYNLQLDKEKAAQYNVDKIPATIIEGAKDYGIRFYGIPSGYEFATLLEDVLAVSRGRSELSAATLERLRTVDRRLHLQVFVTPTCPYCPAAVWLAHQFAMESDLIRADMVEATEFPHLVYRYGVRGVPRTVVNEAIFIDGSLPEKEFLARVLDAAIEPRTEERR